MKAIKRRCLLILCLSIFYANSSQAQTNSISLQALLSGMSANNDLLKYYNSMVQSKQAEVKSVTYDRLPHVNTMYQATVGSVNNVQGSYIPMGLIPSLIGANRDHNDLSMASGNTALAGIDWEVLNFGGFKAREDLAKSGLALQSNVLNKTNYDLNGIAAGYYLELLRLYELKTIDQDNVTRLQLLLSSISGLISNGIRPGVDSSIASSELSKSKVALYEAQKNMDQIQVQLSTLSGLPASGIVPDTTAAEKLINTGAAYTLSSAIDTAHHPDITLYTSMYDYSMAKLKLEKKKYYPKVMMGADVWTRGSSLNNADQYTALGMGFAPQKLNYIVGLALTYDIMNIVKKKLGTSVYKYEAEASAHELQLHKDYINNDLQSARIENSYQLDRLHETERQLNSASIAYDQQENLYRNGLSSLIDLNLALNYFIQARKDHLNSQVGYMRSIINYALVTNSFNSMVQTLKL